ncbi:RING finger protein 17-like protein [Leptotrombidium deliense]|uniref:RING finger protein 17-like protein n=1 Tax=Leptotrombidium deliense TaxID=299467 RepID=A0A443SHI5_9ACAR|nr:RING finger protein 17-like protein [Leptotrombidium deliense]
METELQPMSYFSPLWPVKQIFKAVITEVDSNLNVYFRVIPESGYMIDPFSRVTQAIEASSITAVPFRKKIEVGDPCTAKSETTGDWQRAEIEKIDFRNMKQYFVVRFIDSGVTETLTAESLSPQVIAPKIPKLALCGNVYRFSPDGEQKKSLLTVFKECLLEQEVEIRWQNFLSQVIPMQVTIMLEDYMIFKPIQTTVENGSEALANATHIENVVNQSHSRPNGNQVTANVISTNNNTAQSTNPVAFSYSSNNGEASLTNENFSNSGSIGSDEVDKRSEYQGARPKQRPFKRQSVKKWETKLKELGIDTSKKGACEATSPRINENVNMQITNQELQKMQLNAKALEIMTAINKSPFQKQYPNISAGVFYPIIVSEYVDENYCFVQMMPIEYATNEEEVDINLRHTVFLSLIDQMRREANSFNTVFKPQPGSPVCAQFDDDEWYRAVVLNNSENGQKSKVVYVDYGNVAEVRNNQLRELPYSYINPLPAHAFLVKLNNIRPFNNESWKSKHSELLRNTLADIQTPLIAVFSTAGFPLEADIFDESELCLRSPRNHPLKKLIECGEFEFVDQPFVL